MMKTYRTLLLATSLVCFGLSEAQAYPLVDITLVPGQNNDLEVRVRPDGDFNELFSSIAFTIRWSAASGAALGQEVQDAIQQDVININPSGPEQVDGAYRYQVYVGFSFTLMSDIPAAMQANTEFTLCTIPVLNAQDVFSIVNDPWTLANNADFYVSLGGQDRTGIIYDQSTGVAQRPAGSTLLSVWPSPVVDVASVEIASRDGGALLLTLLNAAGQQVMERRINGNSGSLRERLDMSAYAAGVYVLRLREGDTSRQVRFVKR